MQALLLACLRIAIAQALVFARIEGGGSLGASYFAVVSMATVGNGDLAPETCLGEVAVVTFLIVVTGIFALTVSSIARATLHQLMLAECRTSARAKLGVRPRAR